MVSVLGGDLPLYQHMVGRANSVVARGTLAPNPQISKTSHHPWYHELEHINNIVRELGVESVQLPSPILPNIAYQETRVVNVNKRHKSIEGFFTKP